MASLGLSWFSIIKDTLDNSIWVNSLLEVLMGELFLSSSTPSSIIGEFGILVISIMLLKVYLMGKVMVQELILI